MFLGVFGDPKFLHQIVKGRAAHAEFRRGGCAAVVGSYTIVDFICTALWSINLVVSLRLLQLAYLKYKAGGGSVSSLRSGVLRAAATAAVS